MTSSERLSAPVLVVEDDPELRRVIQEMLEDEGLTARTAMDGMQALEHQEHQRPALMILDIMLPDIDGEGVANALRSAYGKVPILVLTALYQASEEIDQIGAYGYLRKPFTQQDLLEAVRRGMASSVAVGSPT
jgi:CheY-like chemotaxis protein